MFWKTILKLTVLELVLANKDIDIDDDPAAMQLELFKEENPVPVGILTTSSGAPVGRSEFNTIRGNLIRNNLFMDEFSHFVRERIPERVVHARGAGAFGYFEVTHDLTNRCKAKLFEKVGKKTPIAVRFSGTITSKGGSDTNRESRGFAVKFYTEEGNLDIVGLNIPVFNIFDPIWFPSMIHSNKPNPVTNVIDFTSFWDFVVGRRESLFETLILASNRGTPDGYRYMPGYSIHALQVVNNKNESYFMRFHFEPELGERFLNASEAIRLAGAEPDYATKDLYNAIAKGNYPTWSVEVQVLSVIEASRSKINPFDTTKLLPEDEYPLQPLGRIVLDRNPDNFFADIEQLAYCPSNLVPGIVGAPDKLFEARSFAYRDAHNYRLGGNKDKILVNCPYRTKVFTYNRDGRPPVGDNMKGTPNYIPNSFSGPIPSIAIQPNLLNLRNDFTSNFDQVTDFINSLTSDERKELAENVAGSLCKVPKFLKDKVIVLIAEVSIELSVQVTKNHEVCRRIS